jgi:hypothetical protein
LVLTLFHQTALPCQARSYCDSCYHSVNYGHIQHPAPKSRAYVETLGKKHTDARARIHIRCLSRQIFHKISDYDALSQQLGSIVNTEGSSSRQHCEMQQCRRVLLRSRQVFRRTQVFGFGRQVTTRICNRTGCLTFGASRWNDMFSTLRDKWKGLSSPPPPLPPGYLRRTYIRHLMQIAAEVPFQREVYTDGDVETQTVGDSKAQVVAIS